MYRGRRAGEDYRRWKSSDILYVLDDTARFFFTYREKIAELIYVVLITAIYPVCWQHEKVVEGSISASSGGGPYGRARKRRRSLRHPVAPGRRDV